VSAADVHRLLRPSHSEQNKLNFDSSDEPYDDPRAFPLTMNERGTRADPVTRRPGRELKNGPFGVLSSAIAQYDTSLKVAAASLFAR
jgi:hypothetical protein